ncbi:MAG: sigma-54-dependent Fis family transcriptional regulator [Bdellovibrionales bacterium]|nr:sigma-54-dependent Fis family transcriptional regulator [Bdellovibrionales bacterium]
MFDQTTEVSGSPVVSGMFGRNPVFRDIITANPEMEKIFHVIEKVAGTNSTVLILGDSGTGKELIARALHDLSGVSGPFVPVNCGAIPDNLLESELFGHEKGAFTGAISSKPGRFMLANNGTIFLDEIGEMTPNLQVKLLRVLQERVIEPVGGVKSQPVNVRVIAATNVNLWEKVQEGSFREDLYYRLQVVPIELPSLSERPEDITILANHFSHEYALQNNRRPLVFSPEVLQVFGRYRWPGNIREFENLIERLTILVDGDAVYVEHLPRYLCEQSDVDGFDWRSSELPEDGLDFNSVVDSFENSLIMQALERTKGNKKAAAELLNLNRTTLVEKIKKKGIGVKRDEEETQLKAAR